MFHNPAQKIPALGAAYLTFTNAARALPVPHTIKDNLAVKWSEAFEQTPLVQPHSMLQAAHSVITAHTHTHTYAHRRTQADKLGQIEAVKDGKYSLYSTYAIIS